MTVRYVTTTSILNGKPGDAVVLDDADRWLIVTGSPKASEYRTRRAQPIIADIQELNPDATLADVLQAYVGSHSYSRATGWIDSPDDFDTTVQRLTDTIVGR